MTTATARRHEAGQATPTLVILAVAILVLGGLVFDGGQVLAARREAINLARQAARAGAQELDEASLRAGAPQLDAIAADSAARTFLAPHGDITILDIEVTVDTVTVTVERTQPTPLLALVGISERTVTASGTARSVRGVEAGGP